PSAAALPRLHANCPARAEVRVDAGAVCCAGRARVSDVVPRRVASWHATLSRLLAAAAAFSWVLSAAPAGAQDLNGIRRDDVVVRFLPDQASLARAILPQAVQPFPGLPSNIHARGNEVTVLLAPDDRTF